MTTFEVNSPSLEVLSLTDSAIKELTGKLQSLPDQISQEALKLLDAEDLAQTAQAALDAATTELEQSIYFDSLYKNDAQRKSALNSALNDSAILDLKEQVKLTKRAVRIRQVEHQRLRDEFRAAIETLRFFSPNSSEF